MTTKELKYRIVENVLKTKDEEFLKEINEVLQNKVNEPDKIVLTEYQKKRIDEGIKEIEEGNYKTSEEVFRELREWIEK